ncbi:MAG: YjbQ family protein [Bacteroidales bacterium]|nr:YjbQ family protein [Bacteroidales bacterium]
MIKQKEISLPAMHKGFHLIDNIVLNAIGELPETGLMNLFIKHTSAALMLNENADSDVRVDLNTLFDKIAPEGAPFYTHTLEGKDDMPAHFKTAVLGTSLTIPITNHRLNTGTWQGIYFCEFRNHGGNRKLVITVYS